MIDIPSIPGYCYSGPRIFKKGDSEPLTEYENEEGYRRVMVYVNGEPTTMGVHRLIMLGKEPNVDASKLQANHKDLNPRNNDPDNLEWVTQKENNIHAALFSEDNTAIKIHSIDEFLDEELGFTSIPDFCAHYNIMNFVSVWDAIKAGKKLNGRWTLKHIGSKDRIPEGLQKPRIVDVISLMPTYLKAFDCGSDEVLEFKSMHQCAKHFDTSNSHIFQCLSTKIKIKGFRQRWLITRADGGIKKITQDMRNQVLNSGPRDVLAINKETGE